VIATPRGLAILAAIALVLALLVAASPERSRPVDRSLAPQLDAAKVISIDVKLADERGVRLVREAASWVWDDDKGKAEPTVIDAMLDTVEVARWHRTGPRASAGTLRGRLEIAGGGHTTIIELGREVPGAAQTWLVVGERRAVLVDSWIATALFPSPLALRLRRPLAGVALARTITIGGVTLEGAHLTNDARQLDAWIVPSYVARLVNALVDLEIIALPSGPPPASPPYYLSFDGPMHEGVVEVGSCSGDRVLLHLTSGDGCVSRAAWQEVQDAIAPLLAGSPDLVDLRPLPITPTELVLADGTKLALGSAPLLPTGDADPTRVDELVRALATQGERAPRPADSPTGTITARDAAGTDVVLELFAATKLVARRGEAFAIRPSPDAWAVITRPSTSLRDPVRWREDATAISSITIGGTTYTRGTVLGEWTRTPAGSAGSAAVDPALVDALALALATVRAPDALRGSEAVPLPLTVEVTFTPPAGAPTTHELALGAPGPDGCPARIDGARVVADLALCTAAHALR
jgi:hypothetical protein